MKPRLLALGFAAAVCASPAAAQPAVELQYLQHSGWIVRTETHVLVFDYVERLPSGPALPAALRLSADSFDDRRVVVFVSHGHDDHFDAGVGAWARTRPGIQYVVGSPSVELPGAKLMRPRETWSSAGLTVRTTASTDEGVGFLVTVDGVTLYHAGDHARWAESLERAFMSEIDWLKNTGQQIDLAFFPITTGTAGRACDPRPSIWAGVRSAARTLVPRVLIPMHVGCLDRLDLYARFQAEIGPDIAPTQIAAVTRRGQVFRYTAGTLGPG